MCIYFTGIFIILGPGVFSSSMQLSEEPSLGSWKIIVEVVGKVRYLNYVGKRARISINISHRVKKQAGTVDEMPVKRVK